MFLIVALDVDLFLLIDRFLLICKNLEVGVNEELEVGFPNCMLLPHTNVLFCWVCAGEIGGSEPDVFPDNFAICTLPHIILELCGDCDNALEKLEEKKTDGELDVEIA